MPPECRVGERARSDGGSAGQRHAHGFGAVRTPVRSPRARTQRACPAAWSGPGAGRTEHTAQAHRTQELSAAPSSNTHAHAPAGATAQTSPHAVAGTLAVYDCLVGTLRPQASTAHSSLALYRLSSIHSRDPHPALRPRLPAARRAAQAAGARDGRQQIPFPAESAVRAAVSSHL
eukprot:5108677-Prymnesium_polylepis.2